MRELTPLFGDHHAKIAIVWDAAAHNLQALPDDVRPETIISINLIDAMPLSKRLLLKLPIAKARASRAQLSQPATGTVADELLRPGAPAPRRLRPQAEDFALLLYTSAPPAPQRVYPHPHQPAGVHHPGDHLGDARSCPSTRSSWPVCRSSMSSAARFR